MCGSKVLSSSIVWWLSFRNILWCQLSQTLTLRWCNCVVHLLLFVCSSCLSKPILLFPQPPTLVWRRGRFVKTSSLRFLWFGFFWPIEAKEPNRVAWAVAPLLLFSCASLKLLHIDWRMNVFTVLAHQGMVFCDGQQTRQNTIAPARAGWAVVVQAQNSPLHAHLGAQSPATI